MQGDFREERIVKEKKRTEEEKGCVAAGRWPRREKSKRKEEERRVCVAARRGYDF